MASSHAQDERTANSIMRDGSSNLAAEWAKDKGLILMLTTLQPSYGHLFEEPDKLLAGLAARAAIAWQDITHSEVSKAYKRASLRLHPDRMRRRDVAVRLEAEEVLKQLTQAYSDAPAWYKGFAEKRTRQRPRSLRFRLGTFTTPSCACARLELCLGRTRAIALGSMKKGTSDI
eukprot:6204655-Pleurochrysis_carterae.AAC.2